MVRFEHLWPALRRMEGLINMPKRKPILIALIKDAATKEDITKAAGVTKKTL